MVVQTETDGVPTLLAPGDAPLTAGLVFRVGTADETLATHGITHLVEHLALHRHGLTDYHYNGLTAPAFTMFFAHGTAEEVAAFLTGVCDSLADLPVERLAQEKDVLRTEAAGRAEGGNGKHPLWRYGTVGYGLAGAREWGLHRLTGSDVRDWVATYFNRDNAVLWVAGDEVPAGLKLNLAPGQRRPLPKPSSTLPSTPAYFTDARLGAVLDTVVPAGPAATVYAELLRREAARALVQEGGYASAVAADYDRRFDGYATVTVATDAIPEQQGATIGALVDTLARLRLGAFDDAAWTKVRDDLAAALDRPGATAGNLLDWSMRLLTGATPLSLDERRAALTELTREQLCEVARVASEKALLRIPDGYHAEWAGFARAPEFSKSAVDGVEVLPVEALDELLVLGTNGISLCTPEGPLTVRYARCRAQLRWPDGARRFIGPDGIAVTVEPTLWQLSKAQLAELDAAVPDSVVVPLPARDAAEIPQPDPKLKRKRSSVAPRVSREPVPETPQLTEREVWAATREDKEEYSADLRESEATRHRRARTRIRLRIVAVGVFGLLTLTSLVNPAAYSTGPLALGLLVSAIRLYVELKRYDGPH